MQKTYTVTEIAALLDVNIETVRRWIRKGALAAELSSRKEGNVITEAALNRFLRENSKYKIRARQNGHALSSFVEIKAVNRLHRELNAPVMYAAEVALKAEPRFPENRRRNAGEKEYMRMSKEELIAIVDTKQKEIDRLQRRLCTVGAETGNSVLKKR